MDGLSPSLAFATDFTAEVPLAFAAAASRRRLDFESTKGAIFEALDRGPAAGSRREIVLGGGDASHTLVTFAVDGVASSGEIMDARRARGALLGDSTVGSSRRCSPR